MVRQSRKQSRRRVSRRRVSRRRVSRRKQSRRRVSRRRVSRRRVSRRKQSRRRVSRQRVSRRRVSRRNRKVKHVSRRKNIYRMMEGSIETLDSTILVIQMMLTVKLNHILMIQNIYEELLRNRDFQILGLLAIQDEATRHNIRDWTPEINFCFDYCNSPHSTDSDKNVYENAKEYIQNLRNKNPLMCQFLCRSAEILQGDLHTIRPPAIYISEFSSINAVTALKLFAEQSIGDNYLEMIKNLHNLYNSKIDKLLQFEDLEDIQLDYSDEKIIEYYKEEYGEPKNIYYLEWLVMKVTESYLNEFIDGRPTGNKWPFPPSYIKTEIEDMWLSIKDKKIDKMHEILEIYHSKVPEGSWYVLPLDWKETWWETHVLNDYEKMLPPHASDPYSNKNVLSYLLSKYPTTEAIKHFFQKVEAPPGMFTTSKFMNLSPDIKESLLLETSPDQAKKALSKLHSTTLTKAIRDISKTKSKQASLSKRSGDPQRTPARRLVRTWFRHRSPGLAENRRQELIRLERLEKEKLQKHLTKHLTTQTYLERARSYKSLVEEPKTICRDVNCSLTKGRWFPHSHATKLDSGKLSGGVWPAWPSRHWGRGTKSQR